MCDMRHAISFTQTGSLGVRRASKTTTLPRDGRMLFAGGYNCAARIW